MNNPLAKKFSMGALIKFAVPNMIMMLFSSMYVIVDGIFVSRFLGTLSLSAVNMIYPTICFQLAVGIMIATGGSAIIARKLGEGKERSACASFTFLVIVTFLAGVAIAAFSVVFMDQILAVLGVSQLQADLCRVYGIIMSAFAPFFLLQTAFQVFFVTAGKPGAGLVVIVAAGIANMALDYLFMGPLGMGIAGAALATGIGYCIPSIVGIIFFANTKKRRLHFAKPRFEGRTLIQSCANGSSEMVTNLANAVTTFLFNYIFMRYWGEDGVASITIVMYFQYVLTAIHFGYANGVAPIISYKFGCGDQTQLRKIVHNSLWFVAASSVGAFFLSQILAGPVASFFSDKGSHVYAITVDGLRVYAVSFVLMGVSIFVSAMFTALSDGKTSAIISFARTFVFLIAMILLLPPVFGETGVWLTVPAAELLGIIVAVVYFVKNGKPFLSVGKQPAGPQ